MRPIPIIAPTYEEGAQWARMAGITNREVQPLIISTLSEFIGRHGPYIVVNRHRLSEHVYDRVNIDLGDPSIQVLFVEY